MGSWEPTDRLGLSPAAVAQGGLCMFYLSRPQLNMWNGLGLEKQYVLQILYLLQRDKNLHLNLYLESLVRFLIIYFKEILGIYVNVEI